MITCRLSVIPKSASSSPTHPPGSPHSVAVCAVAAVSEEAEVGVVVSVGKRISSLSTSDNGVEPLSWNDTICRVCVVESGGSDSCFVLGRRVDDSLGCGVQYQHSCRDTQGRGCTKGESTSTWHCL